MSYFSKSSINYTNYYEFYQSVIEKYPDRFFEDIDNGIKVNSLEFHQLVQKTILLIKSEIKDTGKRIGVCIENSLLNVIVYYSVILSENIYIPLSNKMTHIELKNIISSSNINLVLSETKHLSLFEDLVNNLINLDDFILFNNLKTEEIDKIDNKSKFDDEIEIFFTSGTTGSPKGIVHTQKSRILSAIAVGNALGFNYGYNLLSFLPLTHTASWTYIISPGFYSGSNIFYCKKFSKSQFWEIIKKYEINYVQVVPTILSMLLNPPENVPDEKKRSLKCIGCGSAPLPMDTLKRFEETFHIPIINLYGLSETGPTHYISPTDEKRYKGSLGLPIDINKVKIVNKMSKECKPFESGEILIKGPNLMKGYFFKDGLDRENIKDGWFYTGDIGYLDEDGHLYLLDRKKDVIIKGGINIYPSEIDDLLFGYPDIVEVCTVGVKDDIYGENVVSYVVARNNNLYEKDIIDFCRKHMEGFKCPKKIIFIDRIPKGPTGKFSRRELANLYLER